MTDAEWATVKATEKYKEKCERAARWMRECFDTTIKSAKDFKNELIDDGVLADGREVADRIRKLGTIAHGPSRENFEEKMEETAYFTSGMAEDAAKRSIKKYVKHLKLVGVTDLSTVTSRLVKKARMDHGANESGWSALSEAIADRVADGEPPYTLKVLTDKITVRLAVGHRQTAMVVNGAWARGKCFVCGKEGHQAKDCTAKCDTCGLKCCQGARGLPCAVANDVDLDKCVDGVDRPIEDFAKRKIMEKRDKARPKVGAIFSGERPLVF
jgi:hypothetical protein